MPLESHMVHPNSLSNAQQRRVIKLRDVDGCTWSDIAGKVRNLKGEPSTPQNVSDPVEFATTPSGEYSYLKDLYAVPFVATFNFSTGNLGYLERHDFLGKSENRVLVKFHPRDSGSAAS